MHAKKIHVYEKILHTFMCLRKFHAFVGDFHLHIGFWTRIPHTHRLVGLCITYCDLWPMPIFTCPLPLRLKSPSFLLSRLSLEYLYPKGTLNLIPPAPLPLCLPTVELSTLLSTHTASVTLHCSRVSNPHQFLSILFPLQWEGLHQHYWHIPRTCSCKQTQNSFSDCHSTLTGLQGSNHSVWNLWRYSTFTLG